MMTIIDPITNEEHKTEYFSHTYEATTGFPTLLKIWLTSNSRFKRLTTYELHNQPVLFKKNERMYLGKLKVRTGVWNFNYQYAVGYVQQISNFKFLMRLNKIRQQMRNNNGED